MNSKIFSCFLVFTILASLSAKSIEVEDLVGYGSSKEGAGQKRLIEFKRLIDFKRNIDDELNEISSYQEKLEELKSFLSNNYRQEEENDMRNKRPSVFSGTRSINFNKD